jgi:hypothetical protein
LGAAALVGALVLTRAAAMSFFMIFALFPAVLLLVALVELLPQVEVHDPPGVPAPGTAAGGGGAGRADARPVIAWLIASFGLRLYVVHFQSHTAGLDRADRLQVRCASAASLFC